ncbi:LysM peptidoglycan-binding domain-containing protein [Temperatibacter marinus]|uniref:LysM peptidoglycan-binding domain-containing protein n=1 Tax=Temperatibacter marinus TaxID=1456591 RepID=A0AA52EHH4_9PROT|nr:LysM peptidoglycan-binding domain-containing protein [Temperatibacter marinus]WND02156.1 LysM peptidoglycan-binding domain-containing protein [Temperatibacter marinus]
MNSTQKKVALAAGLSLVVVAGYFLFSGDPEQPHSTPNVQKPISAEGPSESAIPAIKKPTFDLVRISQRGTGVVAGNSEAGALVSLYGDGLLLSTVKAEDTGDWVVILQEPLKPGALKFTITSEIPGSAIIKSDDEVLVSVPTREENKFLKDKKSGVLALLSKKDGTGPSKVLQKPGGAVFSEVGDSLSIDTIEYGGGKGFINGQSLPRVEVRVYLDDKFLGNEKANDKGQWSLQISNFNLSMGQHVIRVDQTINEGDVKLRIEQPFETGIPLDPSQAKNGVIVKPGNTLWHIARKLYGSGVQYTMIFQENSEKIANPDLIYPGQIFELPNRNK